MNTIEHLNSINKKWDKEIQRCNEAMFRFIDAKKNAKSNPEDVLSEAGAAILRQNNVISSMKSDLVDIINDFSNYLVERNAQKGESFADVEQDAKDFIHAMNLKDVQE